MTFTQKDLDLINKARKIMRERLKIEPELMKGKFTKKNQETVLNFLKMLDLEIFDEDIKAQIEGTILYLENYWGIKAGKAGKEAK